MQEVWKDVIGYEKYQVSSEGNIRRDGRVLKPTVIMNEYKRVHLYRDSIKRLHSVHRIVCQAFIDNPNNKVEIIHINNNRTDNRVTNLQWVTRLEQALHTPTQKCKYIFKDKNSFQVQIRNSKCVFVKSFSSLAKAIEARDAALISW